MNAVTSGVRDGKVFELERFSDKRIGAVYPSKELVLGVDVEEPRFHFGGPAAGPCNIWFTEIIGLEFIQLAVDLFDALLLPVFPLLIGAKRVESGCRKKYWSQAARAHRILRTSSRFSCNS